jgi:inhibitor of cysteine peptidase
MKPAPLLALALAAAPAAPAAPAADVTVGKEMNGKTVALGRGRTLAIRLPSNATTGYSWTVSALPPILKRAGDAYLGPRQPIPGAGGAQLLRFQALRGGRGTLRLAYKRPWEKDWPPPAERYALIVVVR